MKNDFIFKSLIIATFALAILILEILLIGSCSNENVDANTVKTEVVTFRKTEAGTTIQPIEESKPKKELYTITAYCACKKCCGKTDGITASGVKAVEGITVAADTKKLPFGTQVEIDGHIYTVQDRGGAIKGNRIDIYFESHEKALQYGKQTKEIIILKGE